MYKKLEITPSQSNNFFLSFPIVSRFCIKDTTFLVVCLSDDAGNGNSMGEQLNSNLPFPLLGQFNCDGNYYAIISSHNTLKDIDSDYFNLLTARELQVAALVALGQSNKQVSTQLHISEWTVSAHLRRIFIKLNVDSRAAMVYKCASLIDRLHQLQDFQEGSADPIPRVLPGNKNTAYPIASET